MATIVNTPAGTSNDSSAGIIIGVIIALVLIVLFFVYGLPYLRDGVRESSSPSTNINVDLPLPTLTNPQPTQ